LNKRISHKGYTTILHFSEEDQRYYGRIENIRDYVDYEGRTVEEAEQAFRDAVEDYIVYLHESGLDLI